MWKDLIQLMFPKNCLGCGEILLRNEAILCLNCMDNLPFTEQHKRLDNEAYQKFYGRIPIQSAACFLYFSKGGFIQNLIHQLKYNNHPEISYYLGKMYALKLRDDNFKNIYDAIVPVPLHKVKLKLRGYNQVDGFATALSEVFEIPIKRDLLYKSKKNISQTTKNMFERTSMSVENFEISYTAEDIGKHYLLIDDVLTSGATLESCGRNLLQIPKTKVSFLCLTYSK